MIIFNMSPKDNKSGIFHSWPFGKKNYLLFLIGVLTIIAGKIKMQDGKIIGSPEGTPLSFDWKTFMKKFLDLGLQPLANKYLTKKDLINRKKEQFYHLEVGFDNKTKLVSILNKISSYKMFDNNYPYRSSMSKTMIDSFKKLSKKIIRNYKPRFILEIGSNDGSLIQNFNKKKVICVEPCKNLAKMDEFSEIYLK